MAYAILPVPMEEFTFKPFPLFVKCATFTAISFGSAVAEALLPRLLEWWSVGEFPIESLIATFSFEDINDAVDAAKSGEVIKPVLLME
jgi:aryl-alcohol dehydrogenase